MSKVMKFFENDDVLLQLVGVQDNTEQTPASATVEIRETNGKEIVPAGTNAPVVGPNMTYQHNGLEEGTYTAYFTGTYGTEKRTGTLKFVVVKKDGQNA